MCTASVLIPLPAMRGTRAEHVGDILSVAVRSGFLKCIICYLKLVNKKHGNSVDNTVEENSCIFSFIRMHLLLSARACRQ